MKPSGPHLELTDPENKRILATLTSQGWHLLNGRLMRAKFFAPEFWDLSKVTEDQIRDLLGLSRDLYEEAIQTSGAIGAGHRKDLTDAIRGSQATTGGVTIAVPNGTAGPEAASERAPRRGF
ncbi:MAG: hypothetical protein ACYDDF_05285 [Thermoplasmatota archaeon]